MPTATIQPKKTVSVTLEPALLQQAREAGINLSATLTAALRREIRTGEASRWQQTNSQALDELNRITSEHGLLSDDERTF
ncbi:type II toxin-antitoxin system CcdA family antitoxin [Rahnella sp. BCC 1045]|uniref:type II toxin-antitoxin system CcdA family antitoxin n=1 Tax=Rahnella sp. BCC 1045 TaxID=2816251 RepID=UPI001C255892|nr:type II toxin-antitoxin system CcdA family antitoxin [Rahnella sp. BCC 1045]MBU9819652.1 type II toxin-antitoxin system CcdA family antitoxin [Rahnella sp. BCC 1045]